MNEKYQIIYADPAWDTGYVKGGKTAGSVKGGEALPYPVMSDKAIMDLPVKDIVADDAFLFMWIPESRLPIISDLFAAWGFTYKAKMFTWIKTVKYPEKAKYPYRSTLSFYSRRCTEDCYVGTRGKIRDLVQDKTVLQVIDEGEGSEVIEWASPNRRHSFKPPVARKLITRYCGNLKAAELFARNSVEGFDSYGFDIDGQNLFESLKSHKNS